MPYPQDHKQKTRRRIVEAARILFNRHGYDRVSIDEIMAESNLTRGGFYAHFSSKEELFAEATASFLHGRGAQWHRDSGVDPYAREAIMASRMVEAYLSRKHLEDLDGQCPLIAYATDAARAGKQVRDSYGQLAEAMTWLFENRQLPCVLTLLPKDLATGHRLNYLTHKHKSEYGKLFRSLLNSCAT